MYMKWEAITANKASFCLEESNTVRYIPINTKT